MISEVRNDMEFPTIDKFAKEVAEKALDEITYEEKTLREWIDILEQTRWVPCFERLPEKDEVVLITNKWNEVDKALYIGNEMFDIIINYLQKEEVIAWMPLPQPYKAESEDKE